MKDDLAPVSRPHRDGTTREESALVDSSRQWMGGSGDTSLEGAPHSQAASRNCFPCDCSGTVQLHDSGWTLVSGPQLRSAFKVDV